MSKYTAEQVELEATACLDGVRSAMLRAYASTLRQQQEYPECSGNPASCPENEGFGCCAKHAGQTNTRQQTTNSTEIGSKLVDGAAVSDEVVLTLDAYLWKEHGVCLGKTAMRAALEAVAPLLRAPADPVLDADARIGNTVIRKGCHWSTVVGRAQREFTYLEDVGHAPGGQGGRVDEAMVERVARAIAEDGVGRPWEDLAELAVDDLDQSDMLDYARAAIDALAHNTQGEALANTQRAIIEAAERRGYERGHAERARVPDGAVEVLRQSIAADGNAVSIVFRSQETADRFHAQLDEAMKIEQNAAAPPQTEDAA